MTLPEFLIALRQTPDVWYVAEDGAIRASDGTGCCPLTAVAPLRPPLAARYAYDAAAILDIDVITATRIIVAADAVGNVDAVLRQQLLAATVNRT